MNTRESEMCRRSLEEGRRCSAEGLKGVVRRPGLWGGKHLYLHLEWEGLLELEGIVCSGVRECCASVEHEVNPRKGEKEVEKRFQGQITGDQDIRMRVWPWRAGQQDETEPWCLWAWGRTGGMGAWWRRSLMVRAKLGP